MGHDLTDLLREWDYDPDKTIRIIRAEDGRDVLQVRLPLGIEQYELDGRPDGQQFMDRPTVLDRYRQRLADHTAAGAGEVGFVLSHDDFALLQNEATLFYFRYLLLFQIGDFERVARDTGHNLEICEIVENYAVESEDKTALLQYKPYILRMNAVSRAMISLQKHVQYAAQEILEKAISDIQTMPEIDSPAFQFERIRSVNYLRTTLEQVKERKSSPADQLQKELEKAIADERYEEAARIRDRIQELSVGQGD